MRKIDHVIITCDFAEKLPESQDLPIWVVLSDSRDFGMSPSFSQRPTSQMDIQVSCLKTFQLKRYTIICIFLKKEVDFGVICFRTHFFSPQHLLKGKSGLQLKFSGVFRRWLHLGIIIVLLFAKHKLSRSVDNNSSAINCVSKLKFSRKLELQLFVINWLSRGIFEKVDKDIE